LTVRWFSAPEPLLPAPQEEEPDVPIPRPKKRPKKRDHHSTSSDHVISNPHTSAAAVINQAEQTPASPQYSPPSPDSAGSSDADLSRIPFSAHINDEDRGEGPSVSMLRPSEPALKQYPPPPAPISIAPTATVTAGDALSYAMTAQYWAGYWMGVSQALQHTGAPKPTDDADPSDHPNHRQSSDSSTLSNVVVSKHRVLKR
jgi:hypothetical protein